MKLTLNGEDRSLEVVSLDDIWELERVENDIGSARGFAIALNGEVVRRNLWAQTPVTDGDRVEIVRAFAGG